MGYQLLMAINKANQNIQRLKEVDEYMRATALADNSMRVVALKTVDEVHALKDLETAA